MYESLIHSIHSKRGFIQKLNTAVLLGDTQQFWFDFIGNICIGKAEQKQTILCLKCSTVLTSYLLNCFLQSHLHSCYSGQNKRLSCDIALTARLISLIIWYKYKMTYRSGVGAGVLNALKYFNRVIFHN